MDLANTPPRTWATHPQGPGPCTNMGLVHMTPWAWVEDFSLRSRFQQQQLGRELSQGEGRPSTSLCLVWVFLLLLFFTFVGCSSSDGSWPGPSILQRPLESIQEREQQAVDVILCGSCSQSKSSETHSGRKRNGALPL